MNSSLKQHLRSGRNPQQSFLLACYLPSTNNQCIFYEVCLITKNSTSSIEYDLWTCSKQIMLPNSSVHQYDANGSTQFPYDFEFKRVHIQSPRSPSTVIPSNHDQQETLSSPNTNGSLFGVPRLPPKQSTCQSPSWDVLSNTPITTPKRIIQQSNTSPPPPVPTDDRWKEELVERMYSYETHIQSLTTLVSQLLSNQIQQNSISSNKHDVAIQSEPLSSKTNEHIEKSLSPKFEHREQQTSFIDRVSLCNIDYCLR